MSVALDSPLYIVEVDDSCNAQLVGHNGCAYASPPPAHAAQALALVQMLSPAGPAARRH